jgi:acetate kinase
MTNKGSSQLKMTLEELDQMERRLVAVQEKCMTKEERAAREKNRFNVDRKKALDMLKTIKKVLLFNLFYM